MHGLHLTADLRGCAPDAAAMTDPAALRMACLAAVGAAGLAPVGELFHPYAAAAPGPTGVTGVVLLAESHLAVHTWPELDAATLDVYVCNHTGDNGAKAHAALEALLAVFAPRQVERHVLVRGTLA